MNELEVGMYVRTKNNGIGKIVEYINDPTHYFFKCYKLDRSCINCEECITESDVIGEPSYNIIDLIEKGDYVNGYKVLNVCSSFVDIDCEKPSNESYIFDDDIVSIVTKEQFEAMKYEIK